MSKVLVGALVAVLVLLAVGRCRDDALRDQLAAARDTAATAQADLALAQEQIGVATARADSLADRAAALEQSARAHHHRADSAAARRRRATPTLSPPTDADTAALRRHIERLGDVLEAADEEIAALRQEAGDLRSALDMQKRAAGTLRAQLLLAKADLAKADRRIDVLDRALEDAARGCRVLGFLPCPRPGLTGGLAEDGKAHIVLGATLPL